MEQLNHIDKMVQYYDIPDMLEYKFILNVILYLICSQCKSNNVAKI